MNGKKTKFSEQFCNCYLVFLFQLHISHFAITRAIIYFMVVLLLNCLLYSVITSAEIQSGRIKGNDEPQLVSRHVLEGVIEPFESVKDETPTWKLLKDAADQKAAMLMIQQALHEYGQILKSPYIFGEMPMLERYDVFISMAKVKVYSKIGVPVIFLIF